MKQTDHSNIESYCIRKGAPEDIGELEKLYNDLNDYMASNINYPGWIKGIYPTRETAAKGIYEKSLYVAEDNGKIVGTIILNHIPEETYDQAEWLIEAKNSEIFVVRTLVVAPAYLKKHVASALLRFAKEEANRRHIKSIRLDVSVDNIPAIRLYLKMGYQYIATIDLGLPYEHLKWFDLYELVL